MKEGVLKISELRMREDYDRNLEATLQNAVAIGKRMGWLDGTGAGQSRASVAWFEHPLFGAYSTKAPSSAVRRFFSEMFGRTPKTWRRGIQKLAVTALTLEPTFRAALGFSFTTPPVPHPDDSIWLPGNHRFRYFDFADRLVYIFPKANFSPEGIERELAFRSKYASQYPWVSPVRGVMPDDCAFIEELKFAVPFNRVLPRVQKALMPEICRAVDDLHRIDRRDLTPGEYLAVKKAQLDRAKDSFATRFPGVRFNRLDAIVKSAQKFIERCRDIPVGISHGDFQPGNILVNIESSTKPRPFYSWRKTTPRSHLESALTFIDWEDVALRATLYDDMTFASQTRAPLHLSKRLSDPSPIRGRLPLSIDFNAARAIWFLEEWIWLLESSSRPGITRIPDGMRIHFRELAGW